MKKFVTLALALSAAVASPALAGTITFIGTTTGGPTYNRAIGNGNNAPTTLSGVGTAVRYSVNAFTVSQSGGYNFLNTTNYDSYLGIHSGSFNPANALQNAVAYNDDFAGGLDGGFSGLSLLTGVSYFAVSSGFDNSDFGAYSLNINGPGTITGGNGGVPEPATWAMLIFGFAGVGAAMRRRRGAVAVLG